MCRLSVVKVSNFNWNMLLWCPGNVWYPYFLVPRSCRNCIDPPVQLLAGVRIVLAVPSEGRHMTLCRPLPCSVSGFANENTTFRECCMCINWLRCLNVERWILSDTMVVVAWLLTVLFWCLYVLSSSRCTVSERPTPVSYWQARNRHFQSLEGAAPATDSEDSDDHGHPPEGNWGGFPC